MSRTLIFRSPIFAAADAFLFRVAAYAAAFVAFASPPNAYAASPRVTRR